MCNFWSAIITKKGKVLFDKNKSSHEDIVYKYKLKDDKIENRDFVRIEISPKEKLGIFSKDKSDWAYKVDEQGTLPQWYLKEQTQLESSAWDVWQKQMKLTLWKLNLKETKEFIDSIKDVKFFSMSGKIKAEWNVSYGSNWAAAGAAALDAARAAALDAAWDAAWAAARYAAEAAAGAAAWDAARDAAGAAARDAAGAAAWAAAWDAARAAAGKLVGTKLQLKHRQHLKARWEVWTRGYGLYCDVNGKLFVYAVKKEG